MIDTDLGSSLGRLSILFFRADEYIGSVPLPENRDEIPGILRQHGVANEDVDRQFTELDRMFELYEIAAIPTEREPW